MDQTLILWIAGSVLAVTGLAGLLLPLLPGAPLLFLGLFLCAWADNFRYAGLWTLLILAGMAVLTYLVEFVASIFGVRKFGGSRGAMTGAVIGGIVGIFFGLPGILLGPFAGAVIAELILQRTLDEASRAGFGTVLGLAIGIAGKLAIGLTMIGIFVLMRLFS